MLFNTEVYPLNQCIQNLLIFFNTFCRYYFPGSYEWELVANEVGLRSVNFLQLLLLLVTQHLSNYLFGLLLADLPVCHLPFM